VQPLRVVVPKAHQQLHSTGGLVWQKAGRQASRQVLFVTKGTAWWGVVCHAAHSTAGLVRQAGRQAGKQAGDYHYTVVQHNGVLHAMQRTCICGMSDKRWQKGNTARNPNTDATGIRVTARSATVHSNVCRTSWCELTLKSVSMSPIT
jgi:hypothetical protein